MPTHIAILRGINVSGHKKIAMKDLKALFEELDCTNVRTYIQSGNVVFDHKGANAGALIKKLGHKIVEKYGFEVPVLTLSYDEMKAVIKANPFLKEKGIGEDKLHVTFLSEAPAAAQISKATEYNYEPDRFTIKDKAVYVYCPNGYGNTKLNNTFFESKLKVTATTRNWRTVNTLAEMAAGGE